VKIIETNRSDGRPMSREKDETSVSQPALPKSRKIFSARSPRKGCPFLSSLFSEKSPVFVPLASSKKKWISLSPARDIMGGSSSFSSLHRECAHPLGGRQPRDLSDLPSKERDRKKERENLYVYVCTCTYISVYYRTNPESPAVEGTGPRNSITAKLLDWRLSPTRLYTTVSTLFRTSARGTSYVCLTSQVRPRL